MSVPTPFAVTFFTVHIYTETGSGRCMIIYEYVFNELRLQFLLYCTFSCMVHILFL